MHMASPNSKSQPVQDQNVGKHLFQEISGDFGSNSQLNLNLENQYIISQTGI